MNVVTCFSLKALASAYTNLSNALSEKRDGDSEGQDCARALLINSQLAGRVDPLPSGCLYA